MRMKRIVPAAALAAVLCAFAAPPPARADVSVSISFFHDRLAPYGHWASVSAYGNVWIPGHVEVGWAPYVYGQWSYTDYGWTWVSNDPWGDIAYHYGTWAWVPPYGWVWIPGTIWAPAWVTWAYTDDYIGWAPVPPSFSLSVGGYVGGPVVVAQTRYVFVPAPQFVGVEVSRVRVAPQQNSVIFRRATKATSFRVSDGVVRTAGLPAERVERATGRPIERVSIERAKTKPAAFQSRDFQRAKSIPVVAPARERAKAIPASKREVRSERELQPKAHAKRPPEARPAPAARQPEVERKSVERSERKNVEHQQEVERKNVERKNVERKQAEHRPQPAERVREAPAPRPRAEAGPEQAPKPERQAVNRPAKPAPQKARPEPKERSKRENPKAEKQDKS